MTVHFSGQVFDDAIVGTTTQWYTAARFNDALGTGDMLAILAAVTNLSGSFPTLTVRVEHSADARHWLVASTPISAASLSEGGVYRGSAIAFLPVALSFVRLRASLGGSSPRCRLKLFAASRGYF